MKEALVVTASEKEYRFFSGFLARLGYATQRAKNAGEARRLCSITDFPLTVLSSPLPDEKGDGFAAALSEEEKSGVLFVCSAAEKDRMDDRLNEYGVVCIARPIDEEVLWTSVRLLDTLTQRLTRKQAENRALRAKIEELKLCSRAKCLLMSCLGMNENEAHKTMEKQAMDLRISRRELAERIIKTYE